MSDGGLQKLLRYGLRNPFQLLFSYKELTMKRKYVTLQLGGHISLKFSTILSKLTLQAWHFILSIHSLFSSSLGGFLLCLLEVPLALVFYPSLKSDPDQVQAGGLLPLQGHLWLRAVDVAKGNIDQCVQYETINSYLKPNTCSTTH